MFAPDDSVHRELFRLQNGWIKTVETEQFIEMTEINSYQTMNHVIMTMRRTVEM